MIADQKEVCRFTRKSSYDILIKNYELKTMVKMKSMHG